MTAPSTEPASDKPRRTVMQVLGRALKWMLYLFLGFIGLVIFAFIIGPWAVETGWYLAFGWIHFIMKNLATVQLNLVLLTEGIACMIALGIGAHYFCRWLYREAGGPSERAWRWQWTATGLSVVMLMFVAGIGTIGVVHQTAWLLTTKGPLLVDADARRAPVYEAILAASAPRNVVQEYYESKGRLPQSGEEAGYSRDTAPVSKYVSAIEIRERGIVVVTLNKAPNSPDGGEFTFTPTENVSAKTLSWKCHSTLQPRLLPSTCRD